MRHTVVVSVGAGAVFGVLVRLGDSASGAVAWLVNIGGPWILLAFLIGLCSKHVLNAVAALEAAVVAKYAAQIGEGGIGLHTAVLRFLAWGAAALIVAIVFSRVGRAARSRPRVLLLPAAALGAEALAFLTGGLRGESAQLRYTAQPAAVAVFALELALAVALALVGLRSVPKGDAAR